MRRTIKATLAFLALILLFLSPLQIPHAQSSTGPIYSPIYVPQRNETLRPFVATADPDAPQKSIGLPVWSRMYAKQANQTTFRLCGVFLGQGEVALTYPEAGDPYDFDLTEPTPMCIDTPVGLGGGGIAFPLDVWLVQHGARPASILHPNIFVGEQR